jgi:adenine/guanine phosphoribosyltransferase-like PRPP-binding protein
MIERLEGKRVLLVEDVISTGGTVAAELALMKKLGAHVVGVITAIRETRVWSEKTRFGIDPAYPRPGQFADPLPAVPQIR